jgi:hypothetical protein
VLQEGVWPEAEGVQCGRSPPGRHRRGQVRPAAGPRWAPHRCFLPFCNSCHVLIVCHVQHQKLPLLWDRPLCRCWLAHSSCLGRDFGKSKVGPSRHTHWRYANSAEHSRHYYALATTACVSRYPLPVTCASVSNHMDLRGSGLSWGPPLLALLSLLFQCTALLPPSLLPPRRPPAPATQGAPWRRSWPSRPLGAVPPRFLDVGEKRSRSPSLTGVEAFLQGGAPRTAPAAAAAAAAGGGRGRRPGRGGAARPRP